jgi:long-chain acyl-CoA synthetase
LLTLARGGTLNLLPQFEVSNALAHLATKQIERFPVVPSMLRKILSELHSSIDNVRTLFMAGGEPLPAALGNALLGMFTNAQLTDVYGLTETNCGDFIVPPDKYPVLAGTIGFPTPNVRFRITDSAGRTVTDDAVGQLEIRTPYVMRGYLRDEASTRAAFNAGYLRTGDLARRRADGSVQLVGRANDVINRGGIKISPLEVEEIYLHHPDVTGAIVVGIPHDFLGEVPHLALTIKTGSHLSEKDLYEWGLNKLDKYKIPERYHIFETLPCGATGKADRPALRQMILSGKVR